MIIISQKMIIIIVTAVETSNPTIIFFDERGVLPTVDYLRLPSFLLINHSVV
jgi:hypothetical protein